MVVTDAIPAPTEYPHAPRGDSPRPISASSSASSSSPSCLCASVPSCLSPRDSALLPALLRPNFALAQVASDHGLGLHDLTDWLRSEAVQSLIADLLKSSQAILELRLTRARMETVGILESIAKTSEDPTERRRAATALFHRPFTRPKNPTYRLYSIPPAPQPAPFTTPPPSSSTEPLSSPMPRSAPHPSGTSASPCPPSPLTDHRSPSSAAPPLPSSPALFASSLLDAFFKRDTKALLRIFDERSTPDATLDNRPMRQILHLHPLAQMHVSREIAYAEHARTPTRATYTFTFDRAPLSPSRAAFRFDLTRTDGPDWLIHRIPPLDLS